MTPEARTSPVVLRTSYFHRQWGDERIASWSLAFVRGRNSREIQWFFSLESDWATLPRGYIDSVRQRFELASNSATSAPYLDQLKIEEGSSCEVLCDSLEGEPLPEYLKRTRPSVRTTLGLLESVVSQLREFACSLRLLSNLCPEDFLVYSRHGVRVEAEAHPIFSLLREEVAESEFELAKFWSEFVARIHVAAREGWKKEISGYDPLAHRVYRRLLKSLRSGRQTDIRESLEELQRCLRREIDSQRPPTDRLVVVPEAPLGPLRRSLLEEFALEYPEKRVGKSSEVFSFTSPYLVSFTEEDSEIESKTGALLPPEGWFYDSLIGGVNQKMAIPFLSDHPNTQKTRALLCEENFSFVVTEESAAIPLPSLLELKGGLDKKDAFRIAGKVSRALDQFESAEFSFELETPWQLEIYLLSETDRQAWNKVVSQSCEDWPAWDLRVRFEIPTEEIIESSRSSAWGELLERTNGKSFPALLAWLLEWRRLEWAAREKAMEREPVSWDPRINTLFTAAAEHFEPLNSAHRDRLLSLLEQGYESSGLGLGK
ncbi:MAG: hypothetical protein AAF733_01485 [Verrucomicrobiota bacterium]